MTSNTETSSLEFCQRLMSRLVSDIYYNKQNNNKFLLDKVKSIRTLNDPGNKRLKYVLSELVLNSDTLLKGFKVINTTYKKNTYVGNSTKEPNRSSHEELHNSVFLSSSKHKEILIKTLGIANKKEMLSAKKSDSWANDESSDDEDTAADDVADTTAADTAADGVADTAAADTVLDTAADDTVLDTAADDTVLDTAADGVADVVADIAADIAADVAKDSEENTNTTVNANI